MENYRFLIQNKNGLFTSDGRKVYFPDRRNKFELTVGVARCIVSKDFDKYGFLIGEMASNVGRLCNAVEAGKVNLNNVLSLYKIGEYEYWIEQGDDCLKRYCIFVDGKVVDLNSFNYTATTTQRYNVSDFYYNLRSQSENEVDTLRSIKVKYVDNIISNLKKVTRDTLLECIVRSLTVRFPESIKLYNDKIVAIEDFYSTSYYYCDGKDLVSIPSISTEGMMVQDLTDEIEKIILDYNLVITSSSDALGIVRRGISCFNETVEVCLLSNKYFRFKQPQGVVDILEKSKQDVLAFKKRVGKYVTKNNMSELQKLNLKDWQLGRRL